MVIKDTLIQEGDNLLFINGSGQHIAYKVDSLDNEKGIILLRFIGDSSKDITLKRHKEHFGLWYYHWEIKDKYNNPKGIDTIFPCIAKIIY